MASKSKAKKKQASKPKPARGKSAKAPKDVILGKDAAEFIHSIHPKKAAKPKRVITIAGQPCRFIREIKIGERHRKDMGDLTGLARSIDERGALLQPVVIDKDNNLIAGQRRMAAWPMTKFRKEPIPVTVVDIDAIVAGEWDENAKRKDFTPSECASIARALEPIAAAKAKERMTSGKKAPDSGALDAKGNASDLVAAYVGKDRKTIQRAQEIIDAAERDPERFGALVEDMNRTGRVNGPYKRMENIQSGERLKAEPPPPPMQGPYRTLVVDFPWPADLDGYRDQAARGYYPYATMSMEQIIAYAAGQVAPILHDEGAAVWLWIPNFHLVRGCHTAVLKALGVEGSTMLTWVKPEIGQGQRLRGATEHAILAVKGKVPVLGTEQRTWFEAPGGKAHSAKPKAFFEIVEKVTPAPRYAFLFAGGSVPINWDGHGDRIGQGGGAEASSVPVPEEFARECIAMTELQALETIEAGGEIDIKSPIVAFLKEQKLARGSVKLKLTKAGMKRLEQLRREEYSKDDAAPPADRGGDDQVQEENISQVDCRVCSVGDGICVKCTAAGDHVASIDESTGLATCTCGWSMDAFDATDGLPAAIKAHWQNVVTEANAAAASVETAPPRDPLDIPDYLRRRAPAEAAE